MQSVTLSIKFVEQTGEDRDESYVRQAW